jgi:hypothetical protein
MSELQDSWKDVADKAESLGLKLKLHLEQEQDSDDEERSTGETKAMVDELGRKLTDAFDSVGNAAKDPAVHEDVKDIGRLVRDALVTTFNTVGAEVSSRSNTGASSTDAPPPSGPPQDAVVEEMIEESGAGDEADGGDA